jgi:hypothetical protein
MCDVAVLLCDITCAQLPITMATPPMTRWFCGIHRRLPAVCLFAFCLHEHYIRPLPCQSPQALNFTAVCYYRKGVCQTKSVCPPVCICFCVCYILAVCSTAPATNPPNGTFNCPTNATAGKTCAAQCNSGYTGSPTVTCSTNGTWGAVSGLCTAGGPVAANHLDSS